TAVILTDAAAVAVGRADAHARLMPVGYLAGRALRRQEPGARHERDVARREAERNLEVVLDHLVVVELEIARLEIGKRDAGEGEALARGIRADHETGIRILDRKPLARAVVEEADRIGLRIEVVDHGVRPVL